MQESNQEQEKVNQLVKELKACKGKLVKLKEYEVNNTFITSVTCLERAYEKNLLPTHARGLFLENREKIGWKICVRGYDKFFNVGQVKWTTWDWITNNTVGPYEVTLKENGCIIFCSALDENFVLVTSKHSIGKASESTLQKVSHAGKGEEWLENHLSSVKKTKKDLAKFCLEHNVTLIFELADDDFEEHILEYPIEKRGLYLHGVNENTVEFNTWEIKRVEAVAKEFGFKFVDILEFNSVRDVEKFTCECSITGSYLNRAIEGFVVRSKTKSDGRIHFFKVKYDNPYLMFREWREVTNSILRGKHSWKPRYELTRDYMLWVYKKKESDAEFFKFFSKNKGIIAARNLYLKEAGIDFGEQVVLKSNETTEEFRRGEASFRTEDDFSLKDAVTGIESLNVSYGAPTLLIPTAVIGCGKTTLGKLLNALYGIGHVENDDIDLRATKKSEKFCNRVLNAFYFTKSKIVFADKNNHRREHRDLLISAFKKSFPKGKIISLYWDIQKLDKKEVIDVCSERVLNRGENHQTLTPSNPGFKKIIESFVHSTQPIDKSKKEDADIDEIIVLDIFKSPTENLELLTEKLGLKDITREEISSALEKISLEKNKNKVANDNNENEISKGKKKTKKKKKKNEVVEETQNKTVTEKPKREIKYYGVSFGEVYCKKIYEQLNLINDQDFQHLFSKLKDSKRIHKNFHLTLCLNPNLVNKNMEKLKQENVLKDEDLLKEKLNSTLYPKIAQMVGTEIKFSSDRILFNEKILCLFCSNLEGVESFNKYPHVTLGTISESVKPVESNLLLEKYFTNTIGKDECKSIVLDEPLQFQGCINGFYY